MKFKVEDKVIYIDKQFRKSLYNHKGTIIRIESSYCMVSFDNDYLTLCFPEQLEKNWSYYKLKKLVEHGV